MPQITSSIGLISGINTSQIIDQLIALEQQPVTLLQTRIDSVKAKKDAFSAINDGLSKLQTSSTQLRKQSFFEAATVNSSDPNTLTATASNGAAVGSYQFQVARLVTTQQTVSTGFVDSNETQLHPGTLTFEVGGGDLKNETTLADLNGGKGVRAGTFRITDRSGESASIDTTGAVSLDDVVKKINTSIDVQVKASVQDNHLVLTDESGKTTSDLIVRDLGEGHSAADLGLVGDSTTNSITGSAISFLSRSTSLAKINDGRGIRTASSGNDLSIQPGDGGAAVTFSLAGTKSIGDVLDALNTAGGTRFKAEVVPNTGSIRIVDGAGGTVSVSDIGDSKAAEDLGINGSASAALVGKTILSGIDTVALSSLNGGTGISLGTISIQSRAASSGTSIDLSTSKSVADVLNAINSSGAGVTAALNSAGNGIQIVDNSGGTGSIVVSDVSGAGAANLGIAGTFDSNTPTVSGKDLKRAWISQNTSLATLNGGKGIAQGQVKITNGAGTAATIDLSSANLKLGDVISRVNAAGIGVTASINAAGNGLLLTDTSGGAGKLTVEDVDSTAAADLNIKGAAVGSIDGANQKSIVVDATDTLEDVQKKINNLDFGVTASIINDGSSDAPYRLSLTSQNSGLAGRVVVDGGTTGLGLSNLVNAQDAAVFYGNSSLNQPLLVTSSKNQLSGLIKGVNVSLTGVNASPVTLNVTRDSSNVSKEISTFVDNFNTTVDLISTDTKYDTDKQTGGVLLGEQTVQTVQTKLYAALQTAVPTSGKFRTLGDVGLTLDDDGKLVFNSDKFDTAYASDSASVESLFTTSTTGLTTKTQLKSLNDGKGIRTATSGNDLHITLRDGTAFDVSLTNALSVGDVINAINAGAPNKIEAKIGDSNNLVINDLTTGTGSLDISPSGISQAIVDLGIKGTSAAGKITSTRLTIADSSAINSGVGVAIDAALHSLTDPVSGAIAEQKSDLDLRTQQFQDRIKQLNSLIADKKTRLETQFANMESILSGLQSQQQALGSIGLASASSSTKK